MQFSKISEFEKKYNSIKELTPEQKEIVMAAFNKAMQGEDAKEEEAFASAMAKVENSKLEEEVEEFDEDCVHYVQVLEERGKKTSEIEILKVGKVHGRGFSITKEMLNDFVKHYKEGVYGTDIQVNLGHDRGGEAAGWIQDLYVKGDRLLASVEWTPLGIEKIQSKQFRFTSSELSLSHKNHEGKTFKNVLIGVALTNIPQIKGMKAVTLSEAANSIINNHTNNMDKLKQLHELLMSFDSITKSQFEKFSEEAEAAVKDGADEKEVGEMAKEVEGKVEEPAVEKPAVSKEELSEKYVSKEEFLAAQEENAKLQEKIELSELNEMFDKELMLSEEQAVGFTNGEDTKERVVNFLKELTQEQRVEFKEILGLVRTVSLSTLGSNENALEKKTTATLSEDAILEKTEEILAENPEMDIETAQKKAFEELSSQ